MLGRPCNTSPRRFCRRRAASCVTTPQLYVSTGTAGLRATATPRLEQTARVASIKPRRPEPAGSSAPRIKVHENSTYLTRSSRGVERADEAEPDDAKDRELPGRMTSTRS